ncbi:MAG: carboxypeptidase regulatory-like domain-containing protein, partial [Opitutaceae bacterium]
MNPPDLFRLFQRLGPALLCAIIYTGEAAGQNTSSTETEAGAPARTGSIRGRVLNAATGEYLQGAIVHLLGATLRSSTDIRGDYMLTGVPAGTHTAEVSYIGLQTLSSEVTVASGATRSLDFTLADSDMVVLEEMRIESTAGGTAAAINQQRVAEGIRNIVNEDQFGQMNDGNIGYALRRMPGLSVDTDGSTEVPRFVNIRGFDASLNSVTLDGNRLPSTETGDPEQRGSGTAYSGAARAFALDDIPADAITNVEIVKAPTPDMDGDALGGSVNLVTKTAFQRDGQSIDYRIGGSYSELRDEFGTNGALTYSNVFPAFGRDKGLGVSLTASYYDQSEGFDNIDRDYIYPSTSGDVVDLSGIRPGDGALNDYLEPQYAQDRERTGQLAIAFNEDTEYNNYDIDRRRTGLSGSFDIKISDSTELYFKPTINREKRTSIDRRHHLIMDSSDVTGFNHGDAATPLEQYVSPWGAFQPEYNAGNYFEFLEAAEALGVEDQEFASGDSLTVNGAAIAFDPGALVRLGGDPDRISTLRPGSGDLAARTTYNPDGSARGKVRYEGTLSETDLDLTVMNFGGRTSLPWGVIDYNAYFANTKKDHDEYQHELERRGFQFGCVRFEDNPYETDYITENASQVSRFAIPGQDAVDR